MGPASFAEDDGTTSPLISWRSAKEVTGPGSVDQLERMMRKQTPFTTQGIELLTLQSMAFMQRNQLLFPGPILGPFLRNQRQLSLFGHYCSHPIL